ncbi:hypothetical protein Ddc_12898 [Ditylenchus destructor]|nr:hypothetical protein Ddc_12898 [Ditylenchus destructor]
MIRTVLFSLIVLNFIFVSLGQESSAEYVAEYEANTNENDTNEVDPETKDIVQDEINAIWETKSSDSKVQSALNAIGQLMQKGNNENGIHQKMWDVYNAIYNQSGLNPDQIREVEVALLNATQRADKKHVLRDDDEDEDVQ